MTRMTRFGRIALGLAAVVLTASAPAQDNPVRPVTVESLGELLVDQRFTAPASVVPANRSALAAEVAARVQAVAHDVGARVSAGDLLVALDDTDYRLAVDGAQASLRAADARIRQAELRLERAQSLSGDGYISDDDLLARQTELDVLLAEKATATVQLSQARESLARTTIEAPFDGTIVSRSAQVGGYVVPGSPLLTIVEDEALEIEAEIAPEQAEFLASSPQIELHVRNRVAAVELLRLSRVIDAQTRVQTARLGFIFDPMPAGATGTLEWLGARGQLPAGLVVRRGDRYGVFVAENGVAKFVELPNAQEGRPVAVGLGDDTQLVVGGADRLQDGDRVEIAR
ncbi:MAG: efflux RND transporter periplasmic adaptor subunit [Pseudomonadota bacterium]